MSVPGSGWLLEQTVGIARDRQLPAFSRETFRDWFDARGGAAVDPAAAERRVLLIADPYTNYSHPDVGKAAVRVLEAAGVHVRVPADVSDSGRPAFSKAMLDRARETAAENVATLAPRVRDGWDVVTVEPSDAVMYPLDYEDLLPGAGGSSNGVTASDADGSSRSDAAGAGGPSGSNASDVSVVADRTYGVCEYVDHYRLDEQIAFDPPAQSLAYHGHCQQKATRKDHHAVGVLRRAGYEVDAVDSGCCGMAGSFGYEAEHRSMSGAIADVLFDQLDDSPAEQVVAPGASCRSQLVDYGADAEPPHPIQSLADAVDS
jgi:Fe-S oxidoreductase